MLSKEQKEKFVKLGIDSVLELALHVPQSYEDYRLHEHMLEGQYQAVDATVESVYSTANSLQINLFVHNFSHPLQAVIFRPKPYMKHAFKVGEREYYYGHITCKMGHCTLAMPKKITQVGKIVPKYKTKLRNDVMQRLVSALVNEKNLQMSGLPQKVISEIMQIHFPEQLPPKERSEAQLQALKYLELFHYLQQLRKKRKYFQSLVQKASDCKPFIERLPFKLTKDQLSAIEDIRKDFAQTHAARRMIVGDVGSGKTMVILASAFMIQPHKAILMAPTTILASQLYEEALHHLPELKITLVSNKTKKESLEEYDFIIGTHALLYRELPEAALVMVDEQHRFGTQQRNLLEKLVSSYENKPHFLQFSATPIPRTQAMIESAHIDVSLIKQTPFSKKIESKVISKKDFSTLLEHIRSEIAKGNQILLVYPLVVQSEMMEYQSIEEARGYWEKHFENVYVTHGKDKEKEQVLLEFREKGTILIATTVVEVGISLPKLSTVVIVGAERLGLSTLHQLRGRVSRTGLDGYCYLYTNKEKSQRLEEFCKTNSGFDIAMLDLKYRKSGDLLRGAQQSGKQFQWVDMAEDEEIIKEVKKGLI